MICNVVDYFRQSAKRFPDKAAAACDGEEISYRDLDRGSDNLARYLATDQPGTNIFIPFFMEKSLSSIKSMLGILKSGNAYVPVDINSPKDRLLSILTATQARCILVNSASEAHAKELLTGSGVTTINVDVLPSTVDQSKTLRHGISRDIAYVLFTSGSTGAPKGVMIPHQAIVDYIDWCVEEYNLTSDDVISNHAPLYFDNSTFDIYTAFKTGATLHLVPEKINAVLPRLVKWLEQNNITTFFCVPSVLTMLLKSRRLKTDSFTSLRHIIAAGEVLPPQVIREWMLLYPNIQFTNMYGPTEITVDCSYHVLTDLPEENCTSIPIGKARENMELFVREESGQLSQDIGAKGELLVRGLSVAYGYLNNPEKTREVFIQNPSHSLYADLLYCTGDIVKVDSKGDFHFVGRSDNQIKYLGYRIELGEIESRLLTLTTVSEAVVVFGKNKNGTDDFIGVCLNLLAELDDNLLHESMAEVLPPYMVPSVVITMKSDFPKTPNGKYDRKAIFERVCDQS